MNQKIIFHFVTVTSLSHGCIWNSSLICLGITICPFVHTVTVQWNSGFVCFGLMAFFGSIILYNFKKYEKYEKYTKNNLKCNFIALLCYNNYTYYMSKCKKLVKMLTKKFDKTVSYVDWHTYIWLVASLFVMMIWYPFVGDTPNASFWIHLLVSLILITWMYTVTSHDKFLNRSLFLWVFTLIFSWIDYVFFENKTVMLLYMITWLLFFFYIIINLIVSLHNDKLVNQHLIYWTIAWYILLWIIGAFLYAIIELLQPWSFSITMTTFTQFPQFIYFSFVNLTTLGYGDIVPISHHAQSWSVLFTIIWQMYLVILIGVIVGKYVRRGSDIL